jgi:hypothetical protein
MGDRVFIIEADPERVRYIANGLARAGYLVVEVKKQSESSGCENGTCVAQAVVDRAGQNRQEPMAQKKKLPEPSKLTKTAAKPSSLFIRVFENNEKKPTQTVTIPLGVLKLARNFIPNRAKAALDKEGIDLDQVMGLADQQEAPGVLLEVDDHKKKRRIVISIE